MPHDPAFQLESLWRFDAPIETVYTALTEVEDWPQWWPYVAEVETLKPGRGVGAMRRMLWRTRLPYTLNLVMTCTAADRPNRLVGRSFGNLVGTGEWTLWRERDQTCVHYRWCVDVTKPWMRASLGLLAPVFRWNHQAVMAAGQQGLKQWLQRADANLPVTAPGT